MNGPATATYPTHYRIYHPLPFQPEGWNRPRIFVDPDYPEDLAAATYRLVCESVETIPEQGGEYRPANVLDAIYMAHQNDSREFGRACRNPERTRSLSVGDVIEVARVHGPVFYIVAALGFEQVERVDGDAIKFRRVA